MVRPVAVSQVLPLLNPKQTWRQTLLELLRAVGIFEDKSIKITLASDLEFDGVGLLALLYARRCNVNRQHTPQFLRWKHSQDASLRRQISINCLISETSFGIV